MTSSDLSPAEFDSPAGRGGRKLSSEQFVVLNDEIRAFVRAGIPLDVGLRGTAGRSAGALRDVSEQIAHRIQMGDSVEEALKAEGDGLPAAYRAVLAAGLRTGRLDEVLASLSDLAESTTSLRRQLRLAMIYPAIVMTLAYGLFVGFILIVVPQLQRTYFIFNMQESPLVRGLLWLHRTIAVWGVVVPAVAVGLLLLSWVVRWAVRGWTSGVGLSRWIPGGRDLALARFSRILSLMVRHDVPLPEACRLSGEAAGDDRLRRESERLASSVEAGRTLTDSLAGARRLPPFLCWLIAVGERQGSLTDSLAQAAEVYEQRAIAKLDWFRHSVPPAIIIVCCGTITMLYGLTLFLPLSEMLDRLGQG